MINKGSPLKSGLVGELNGTNPTLKGTITSKLNALGGAIGTMNLYDYYTKEEVNSMFGEIVTMKKESYFDFPNIGEKSALYIDVGAGSTYIWDEDTNSYQCIGRDCEKIQEINGGNANG